MDRLKTVLREIFLTNTIPKIICLILAMLSWFFVMENQNPRKSRTFDHLPVTIFGLEVLENRGLIVESIAGESIDVTIDGTWTNVMNFTEQDIFLSATVDATGKGQVTVPINYRLANATVTVKELSQNYLTVQFDAVETQKKPVEVDTTGDLPEGFEMGEMTLKQEFLELTGPSNVLKNVAVLRGEVDISELKMSDVERVSIQAFDSQGNPVDSNKIELSSPFVEVGISILGTKEVPVHVETSGNVADNYRLGAITSTPETLKLYGDTKQMISIREVITTVNVEGKNASFSTNASFDLPDNIRRVDQEAVSIYVDVQPLITQQFPFLMADIEIRGQDANLAYTLGTQETTNSLIVTDTRSIVNGIMEEELTFFVDAEKTTGNYLLDIKVEGLPETSSVTFRIPQLNLIISSKNN